MQKENKLQFAAKALPGILLTLILAGCTRVLTRPTNAALNASLQEQYKNAVKQTQDPLKGMIATNLASPRLDSSQFTWYKYEGETYLLTITWKGAHSLGRYKTNKIDSVFITDSNYNWVTIVPQLKDLCTKRGFGRKEGVEMRLKQILGLKPGNQYGYFVEIWVRPEDIFRPCRDADPNDRTAGFVYSDTANLVKGNYEDWLKGNHKEYPFSELGYTYDWSPRSKTHQGLSEFVIKQNSKVLLGERIPTCKYCRLSCNIKAKK